MGLLKSEEMDFYDKTALKSYNLDSTMRYQLACLGGLDNFTRNNLRNILDSPIKLVNPFKKEVDTHHAAAIPESTSKKLYNSIVRIRVIDGEGQAFSWN